jgi:hypothetical protein
MGQSGIKRAWYVRIGVLVSVLLTAGLLLPGGGRASAAGGTDVNNAGVFELDGDVTHEAATTPPYDWSDLFTSTGQPNQVAGLASSAFIPDPTTNDEAFIIGSSKDPIDISSWQCTSKPVTPKDEVQNSYAAAFIAPPSSPVAGHVLLYMALERGSVNGTSNAGFWILKKPTACNPTTGTFVNPNTGTAAAHSDGDILLFASFTSGGTTASVSLYTWKSSCTTGASGCTSTSPTGGLSLPSNGQDCPTSNVNLCGIANGTAPITTPWAPGSVGTNGFFESGVDLTATLGASFLSSGCFATFLSDTRASASVTAELHDFNSGSFSLCATPKVTTSASQTSQLVGTATTSDTATLSSFAGKVAGETVNFKLFGPFGAPQTSFDCSATSIMATAFSGSASLNASGVATVSDPNTLNSIGTYYWVAYYPGDQSTGGLNQPAQSGCIDEPVTVVKRSPTIATAAGAETPNPGIVGSTVHTSDTATLSGAFQPTGTVTFELLSGACDATKPLTTATATTFTAGAGGTFTAATGDVSFTPAVVGTYYWVAKYGGDANNNPAPANGFSICPDTNEAVPVTPQTPPVTTQASPQTGTVGIAVTVGDLATVFGNDGVVPTGTVTFTLWTDNTCKTAATGLVNPSPPEPLTSNGTSPASSSGTYSTSWTPPATGSYYWTAAYSGDGNYNPAASACGDAHELVTIAKASPTLNTLMFLGDIASVSNGFNPTGTITFKLFNNATCTATPVYELDNVSLTSLSASTLADLGAHLASVELVNGNMYSWQVTYSGDANNNSVTVGCGTVTPASSSGSTATESTGTVTQN